MCLRDVSMKCGLREVSAYLIQLLSMSNLTQIMVDVGLKWGRNTATVPLQCLNFLYSAPKGLHGRNNQKKSVTVYSAYKFISANNQP